MFNQPTPMSLLEYALALPTRLNSFFIMYWGCFGWCDYVLPSPYYRIILLLTALHLVALGVLWRRLECRSYILFALAFSLLYCLGVIAGEFYYLSSVGYVIQGRYFIPAALGFASITLHPVHGLRRLSYTLLLLMNGAAVWETVIRYYDGSWRLLLQALPFP